MLVIGHRFYKAKKNRNNRPLVRYYLPLFEGKKIRHWFPVQYNAVFIIRRQIIIFSLVLLQNYTLTQMHIMTGVTIMMLAYLIAN